MSTSLSQPPCDEWSMMLHGLLDGELDAVNAMQCEKHVAQCEGCAAELARLRELRGILRQENVRWRAPETLRTRIFAEITQHDEIPARQRASAYISGRERLMAALRRWSLVPSLAVLAVSLFIVLAPINREKQLTDDLVAGHVRSLLADHLTDVASSNRHVVKPWFIGKLDFSPPAIDLGRRGFPLIGGRIDYIDEHVVAALIYRRHKHIINVFIWPAKEASSRTVMRDGYNLINWTEGGLTFWAVSDLDAVELKQFQKALAAASAH